MHIAILGGGPSGMFMFKRLVEANKGFDQITIFERKDKLGAGMPYSVEGAGREHITNVSSNEIPNIVTPITDWLKTVPIHELKAYCIDAENFNEYKVLPRLLFGQYLAAQFDALRRIASEKSIRYDIRYNSEVTDIIDDRNGGQVKVEINHNTQFAFDKVVVCTGHIWPRKHEGVIPGYFDSPYPPAKLQLQLNHPVAIKGSSLTAVDAVRTLARNNGRFKRDVNNKVVFEPLHEGSGFKMVLHTRNGMLPAVRFHLENSNLRNDLLLTKQEIKEHIEANDGFLSLDYIFEQDFKLPIKFKHPEFYEQIAHMNLEEFVAAMMDLRERLDPFQLLKSEYAQAEKSIKRKESIYWKEMLGVLSFALNYPAKHLSAEDMQRLQRSLLPLISIVIAYLPQGSAEELMAMHDAGMLELVSVGDDSEITPVAEGGIIYHYRDESGVENARHFTTFVDCVGQPHLKYEDIPFKSLLANKTISPAKIKFKSADAARQALSEGKDVTETANDNYYLKVSGIAINDAFQVLDEYGAVNERIYMMAVPYIGGYNPDYSGLDFGEAASAAIIKSLLPNQHEHYKD
jgi:hypothetical protein